MMTLDAMSTDAVVLFSGAGGSTLGLHDAGIRRSVGVECEPNAAATARTAGFMVHEGDVRQVDPRELVNRYSLAAGAVLLLQSSPPCQGLSMAGKGVGREDLQRLMTALDQLAKMSMDDARYWSRWWLDKLTLECSDEKSPLTFETIRWVADLTPDYVMLEQVPTALPIWEAFAKVLDAWGYSTWTGNVQAEQFGVPQTRKRAFLLASRVSEVSAPTPTHSKYQSAGVTRRPPSKARLSTTWTGCMADHRPPSWARSPPTWWRSLVTARRATRRDRRPPEASE